MLVTSQGRQRGVLTSYKRCSVKAGKVVSSWYGARRNRGLTSLDEKIAVFYVWDSVPGVQTYPARGP